MNIKSAKVLVYDAGGIYSETAVRFMRDCASVKYFTAANEDYSDKIGFNLDGIERVNSPWDNVDDVDFIFCPDISSSEIVEYLKKHNYPCAGAGSIEKLEVDRWWGRKYQEEQGLPVQETRLIQGVTELRKFCKENKNFYIKVDNEYRGISESFKHFDFSTSEPRIDYIAYKVGPFKEDIQFICEELLEGPEPGFDGITYDGDILYPTMAGYEISKKSHVVRVYQNEEELPNAYKRIHNGLKPEFKNRKTRFFYSTEMIIDKSKTPYLLDPTCRMASPGGMALQTELIENFTEVCYGLALEKPILPIIKYKYAIATPVTTLEAEKGFVNISFPKELRQWVKFTQACKKGSDYYSVPPEIIVACVVALGNTLPETIELCKKRMKEVKGSGLNFDDSGLMKIMDTINEGKKVGISF